MTPRPIDEAATVLADPTAYADDDRLHSALTRLRSDNPVAWVDNPPYRPFWAITKHEDIMAIERANDLFLSEPRPLLATAATDDVLKAQQDAGMGIRTLIHMDDPHHRKVRAIGSDWFRPKAMRALKVRVDELAKRYVDTMRDVGPECDFVEAIAVNFPLYVILSLLGLPEDDFPRMMKLTQEMFGGDDEEHRRGDSTEDLLAVFRGLNENSKIDCILVQLPLPPQVDSKRILLAISPDKDVDGFHFINVGKLGTGELDTAFVPCTPAGSMLLIERVRGKDLSGLNAVVVGRSNIVRKPMANLLLAANCTVTIAHSRTKDLPALARTADILVAAVGRPEMIRGDWVKPGATVIDVGINRIPAPEKGEGKSRLVGDVAYAEAAKAAGAITPVPGGVGPMTIAMLMANTLASAYLAAGLKRPSF